MSAPAFRMRRIDLAFLESRGRSNPGSDAGTEREAARIMETVRTGGEPALAAFARELDGNDGRLWYGPEDFRPALDSLGATERTALEAAAARVERFARAQRASLSPVELAVPGGRAGHEILPVGSAGCYVPGGRYPLPSSALMTALTARVAGVGSVAVACPRPEPMVLAACALSGADLLLAAGGAQAIAAFCHGAGPLERRDLIVGPGNRWVAAAKRLARRYCGTDAEAGPSELLVLADGSADPVVLAWDLLAQAEHDPDATAALLATDESVAAGVEAALGACLAELSAASPRGADSAARALGNGWILVSPEREDLVRAANLMAPEHLELAVEDPQGLAEMCVNAGAVFLGPSSAEVFGDYGAGPNHTLPTAGASRWSGGLSVFTFLRVRTWLAMDARPADAGQASLRTLAEQSATLARAEGLEAHARSALARIRNVPA